MRGKTHTPKPVSLTLLLIGRIIAKHAFFVVVVVAFAIRWT